MLSLFNNLRSVARFSGFTSLSPTPCNALGVDDAYLIGSGLSLAGGLFSGLFGSSAQKSTNRTNYKIWLQQQDFNRQEAEKQRQWQQLMQNLYGTSSAKANDLRSAGLNAKLGDVSASSIGSGASASLSSLPEMRPYNVGADISMGINNAASTFYHGYQAETERLSQQSQQDVNDTLVNLNKMRADTEKLVQTAQSQHIKIDEQTLLQQIANTKYLQSTVDTKIRQAYATESIMEWQRQNIKYNALTMQYRLSNLEPAKVQETLTNIAFNCASAFNQFAQGKLTYRQFLNYPKELAIRQTMAQASMLQGRAALMNAQNYGALLRSQTKQQDFQNEQTQFYNDYWLGKVSDEDALKYIKRDIPIWHLYKTNLGISNQTYLNLTYQPSLIQSLTRANNASAVRNEWGKYDDMVRSVTDILGAGADIYTKGATSKLRK
jgi:tellurite resistance protein